jgi:predicted amidophosphoribosyltransferase
VIGLFLDLLFPLRCALCGAALLDDEPLWCSACDAAMPKYFGDAAARFDGRVDWTASRVLLRHRGSPEVAALLNGFKYKGREGLALEIGRSMGRELSAFSIPGEVGARPVLVPVPLHADKMKLRGYNQAERIAAGWSEVTGWPVLDLLIREATGAALAASDREERMGSQALQYRAAENESEPKAHPLLMLSPPPSLVVLVDDVATSGATLEAVWAAVREVWDGPIAFGCAASP